MLWPRYFFLGVSTELEINHQMLGAGKIITDDIYRYINVWCRFPGANDRGVAVIDGFYYLLGKPS